MANKALLWGRQNHNTLKVAQNLLPDSRPEYCVQNMLHKPDNIVKEWWGVQLIQVRWNLNWSLAWVLREHFLSSFLNCSAKWEFRHNPNTVNCFNFLWSDVKQEPREQLKFLAYWLNSVISCKHRWLNRSFFRMKIIQCFSELKESSLNSLPHILIYNQSRTLVFT